MGEKNLKRVVAAVRRAAAVAGEKLYTAAKVQGVGGSGIKQATASPGRAEHREADSRKVERHDGMTKP
jgi:hypothetical protein